MSGKSFIEKIEDAIKDVVTADANGDGYHYNWTTDERVVFDATQFTGDLPRALVELVEEKNVDQPDAENHLGPTGAFSGAYHNVITYKISIGGTTGGSGRSRQLDLFKALEDLKKVFGINYTLGNSGASAIMYKGFEFSTDCQSIDSYWTVRYYQSRTDPSLSAEV